ncbi:MAG TPA: type II toxin-antitoxin system VapC family toxin [Longimicrobiales bacterium]|nr:type II toxin-antitoxin system VapC family toxin [Longimicrobiales bacterium]
MSLLLDTHVFLWWREASDWITAEGRQAISEAETVFVSAASAWEVAIKVTLGKLRIPGPFESAVWESRFDELPITFGHAAAVTALSPHHRDPFDRMLIAQAMTEHLTIVTHDRRFEPYGIPIIWV